MLVCWNVYLMAVINSKHRWARWKSNWKTPTPLSLMSWTYASQRINWNSSKRTGLKAWYFSYFMFSIFGGEGVGGWMEGVGECRKPQFNAIIAYGPTSNQRIMSGTEQKQTPGSIFCCRWKHPWPSFHQHAQLQIGVKQSILETS